MNERTKEQYIKDGEEEKINSSLEDYWNRSRDLESKAVDDLEKTLWIANAGAAAVAIGYIQAANEFKLWQYIGCSLFVAALMLLVLLKAISAINSSRDRYRFQIARKKFEEQGATDSVLYRVRDKWFKALKLFYLSSKYIAAIMFLAGCITTLVGLYVPKDPPKPMSSEKVMQQGHNQKVEQRADK